MLGGSTKTAKPNFINACHFTIYGPILTYLISKFSEKIEKYEKPEKPEKTRVSVGFDLGKNPKPGFAKFRVFGEPYKTHKAR